MSGKILIILSFPFLLLKSEPFEVIHATANISQSGRKEGKSGIFFKIEIVCKKPGNKISFDKIFMGEKSIDIKIVDSSNEFISTFEKKDTIYLIGSTQNSSTTYLKNGPVELHYLKGKKGYIQKILIDTIEEQHLR